MRRAGGSRVPPARTRPPPPTPAPASTLRQLAPGEEPEERRLSDLPPTAQADIRASLPPELRNVPGNLSQAEMERLLRQHCNINAKVVLYYRHPDGSRREWRRCLHDSLPHMREAMAKKFGRHLALGMTDLDLMTMRIPPPNGGSWELEYIG